MIPVKYIDPDDLALYAMHLLPADETEEMASNLQHSVEARRVLGEIRADMALLALSAEPQSPPDEARQRLLRQVAREKKVVPVQPVEPAAINTYAARSVAPLIDEEPVPRSFGARALPWIGWALAAGLLLEVGHLHQQSQRLEHTVASSRAQVLSAESRAASATASADLASIVLNTVQDPKAVQVALTTSGLKPPPQGRVTYAANKGALVFLASNLDPLSPSKTYELWIIPADGQPPIPAGTFNPDAKGFASLVMPNLPQGVEAKAFGVTIEKAGGSPVPTSAIMLHGAAS